MARPPRSPTSQTSLGDTAATPYSPLGSAAPPTGRLQLLPSHCAARVPLLDVNRFFAVPTAHTAPGAADAARRTLEEVERLGLGTMLQVEPFQCPTSVTNSRTPL